MNAVKCPNCGNLNSSEENYCLNCGTSILNLRTPSYAPVAPQQNQAFQSYGFNVPDNFNAAQYENRLGGKVFIWYRVFCGVVALSSLFWAVLGLIAIFGSSSQPTVKEQHDSFNGGLMFVVLGLLFFVPYIVALILPRKPFHWVLGIILIAFNLIPLGFSSCILLPSAIALLIFWLKPETKTYFGRS